MKKNDPAYQAYVDIHMYDHSFLLYFKAPKGHETRFTYMAQGDIIWSRVPASQYWALDSPSILYLICWCCGKCLVPFFNRDGTVCKNSPDSLNLIFARFFCSSFIYSLLRMHNLDVPTPVSFEIVQSELRQGLNTGAKCL